jgi:hypothetical protein
MLRAIAAKSNLTKTTLQHIKSVLSTIFTYAKNEGAFDGANPVDGVLIPRHAKEPGETHAYDVNHVLQILDRLPLLVLRRSKPHVTRERYIKVFDRTVLDAVEKVQARIEELRQAREDRRQLELKFGDDGSVESSAEGGLHPSRRSSHHLTTGASEGSVVSC